METKIGKKVKNVKKIAVLRANAIGDFIESLPALKALKKTYSEAEIILLGKQWHKDFLKNRNSPIDRVIVIPKCKGVGEGEDYENDIIELSNFFREMKKEKFDIAIQMHGGGKNSNPFVENLGAKLTLGFKTPEAMPLDLWHPYIFFQPEVFKHLELLRLIGVKTTNIQPHIEATLDDVDEAFTRLDLSMPIVVIHPSASDMRRRWSPVKFAELADKLAEEKYQIVVVGVESERDTVEEIINHMHYPAQNFCNKLSLGGLCGLFKISKLVVANDSGPSHLAYAVGVRTAIIYWGPNAAFHNKYYSRYHRPIISWNNNCPECGQQLMGPQGFVSTCNHQVSTVDDITVDEVFENAMSLLREE